MLDCFIQFSNVEVKIKINKFGEKNELLKTDDFIGSLESQASSRKNDL